MGGQVGVLHQGPGGRQGVITAGADGHHAPVGVDDLARAGENQQRVLVRDDHLRFQLAHGLVATPHLGDGHSSPLQVAAALGQLFLKLLAQGEGVRHRPGKADDHLPVVQAAHLLRRALENDALPHGDLAVAGNGGLPVAAHGADGGSSEWTAHGFVSSVVRIKSAMAPTISASTVQGT